MRRLYLFLFFILLLLLLFFFFFRLVKRLKEREEILEKLGKSSLISIDTLSLVLRKNEALGSLLARAPYLSEKEKNLVLERLSSIGLDFRRRREGESLSLYINTSSPPRVVFCDYKVNNRKTYRLYLNEERSIASLFRHIEKKLVLIKGEITSSLFNSLLEIGEKPELVVRYAEILEWDIDFWTETQKGDSFFLLTEKEFVDGEFSRYGKIFLVLYKGKIGNFYGVKFQGEYYDLEGKSLKKSFLKSPLRYSYISSHFSFARRHPILKAVRPHRGVDYVAPTGTPVSALGDGTVTYAGWSGGYGKLVVIRHPNNYTTKYGHLSVIRKGISPGRRVRQGELIGYVGATGLATGPHLHFEILKGGAWLNPIKIVSPPKEPVPPSLLNQFQAVRDSLLGVLNEIGIKN